MSSSEVFETNPMPRPPRLPHDPAVRDVARREAELVLITRERENTQADLLAAIAVHLDRIATVLELNADDFEDAARSRVEYLQENDDDDA